MLRTTRRMLLLFVLVVLSPPPLLAQTVHSRFATINGVRLHYLEAGTGSPIIMLHGFGETSHMWLPLIPKRSEERRVGKECGARWYARLEKRYVKGKRGRMCNSLASMTRLDLC